MSRPRNVSALLIGNGNLPIRTRNLELSARVLRVHAVKTARGSYLDNGDAGPPGSGNVIFPVVSKPAARC